MVTKWQKKNVGVSLRKGTTNRKPVTDERDGTVGGYETEHWDDRQDVNVQLKTVGAKSAVQEGIE